MASRAAAKIGVAALRNHSSRSRGGGAITRRTRSKPKTVPNVSNEDDNNGEPVTTIKQRGRLSLLQSALDKPVPSLKDFMHQKKVIGQYRDYLRAIAVIPDPLSREQALKEVRDSFRVHINESDPISINMAVKEGDAKLKQFRTMVGYENATAADDPESWLNIDDDDDQRGRVGSQWPWDDK
mmetsp:Transcript_6549/g.9536  ORF Transcript_6549/g.9536 Transcript_6549/m.9536 type:complete len:182 (+) Transcript_6549:98-643(+)|eukprot:CAMPEP_0195518298 /NCGR_PEP_ID=MMETSP0794_2-20130614/12667_1 /TAXON_ID=515487 /ORGANISM="Stephanopyxis turris, Strain CCMP 815" /LENGTH=181 /DNA_ID=CAMNT_0040647241 /DNA_START=71 /DNA_END=616 /DNA_ORIENTATION=+